MLELDQVDLGDLTSALEDHSEMHSWWLDPSTGAIEPWGEELDEEADPYDRGWLLIEPMESSEGYADMVDFIDTIRDRRARDLLGRAIEGRGAFRRFKDTLIEFPELRAAWFTFHGVRMERRAIDWLVAQDLVDAAAGARAAEARPDPAVADGFDPFAIAREVESELARLYGDRLREVRLYGSHARDDADAESDIDLLVVLDAISSRWDERQRIEDILWTHSLAHDVVISAFPVGEDELATMESPFLARISADATPIR